MKSVLIKVIFFVFCFSSPHLFAELQNSKPKTATSLPRTTFDNSSVNTDLRRGCESISYCGTNTHNRFDDQKADRQKFIASGGCERNLDCPRGTKLVCQANYSLKTCMDIELRKEDDSDIPLGMQTLFSCQQYCERQGKRLPTNNEWLVAALGTDHRNCLPEEALKNEVHPRKPDPGSSRAIEANRQYIRSNREECISAFGIRDMVGVLGQWVTEGQAKTNRAQFNGGYWAFRPSSLFYRTTAHGPGYTDYSIGCRCAADPRP